MKNDYVLLRKKTFRNTLMSILKPEYGQLISNIMKYTYSSKVQLFQDFNIFNLKEYSLPFDIRQSHQQSLNTFSLSLKNAVEKMQTK